MCYDDETCTSTCPATGRKRRAAETALGIFRRDTDEVEYQENGLPGKYIAFSVTNFAQINFNFKF